jgi:hypothetical protein
VLLTKSDKLNTTEAAMCTSQIVKPQAGGGDVKLSALKNAASKRSASTCGLRTRLKSPSRPPSPWQTTLRTARQRRRAE